MLGRLAPRVSIPAAIAIIASFATQQLAMAGPPANVDATVTPCPAYSPTATPPWATGLTNFNNGIVGVTLGTSQPLGGVVPQLLLYDESNTGNPLSAVDGRAAAGQGWQSSYFVTDSNQLESVWNQASGNSQDAQWGYDAPYNVVPSGNGQQIHGQYWEPLYTDHQTTSNGSGTTYTTSPSGCPSHNTYGAQIDDGTGQITVTKAANNTIQINNAYWIWHENATGPGGWPLWSWEQALYLDPVSAAGHNLRVYVHYAADATTTFGLNGVQPYTNQSTGGMWVPSADGKYVTNVGGSPGNVTCGPTTGCDARLGCTQFQQIASQFQVGSSGCPNASYWDLASFIWSVGVNNTRMGICIANPGAAASNLTANNLAELVAEYNSPTFSVGGSSPWTNPSSGVIAWHTFGAALDQNVSFPMTTGIPGQSGIVPPTQMGVNYWIGRASDLNALNPRCAPVGA